MGRRIPSVANTYAEVSPSGNGVKAFFYVATENARPLLDRIGVEPDNWGCRRAVPGQDGRDHGPAVEVYLAARYFAVTNQKWPAAPDHIRLLDSDDLDRLAALIPPPRSAGTGKKTGGDDSRSAAAFRKGAALRRSGASFEEMVAALHQDPETADWAREKGAANGQRELHRIWDKAARPSEDELALRFSNAHPELRYVATWNRWLIWDAGGWISDETLRVFNWSRSICREATKAAANAKTVAAVVSLARSDRRHAMTPDAGTPTTAFCDQGGESMGVELLTGTVRPNRMADYCTKSAACSPKGDARCGAAFSTKSPPAISRLCSPTCSAWRATA